MISRSDDYVEYCRETAKHASDAHDLALRGRDKKEITRLIHERIAEAVDLHPGDDLVDIGCGDGTLLRIAETCRREECGWIACNRRRGRSAAAVWA